LLGSSRWLAGLLGVGDRLRRWLCSGGRNPTPQHEQNQAKAGRDGVPQTGRATMAAPGSEYPLHTIPHGQAPLAGRSNHIYAKLFNLG
jgi:hypothetical protein